MWDFHVSVILHHRAVVGDVVDESLWSRLDSRECEMTARAMGFPTLLRVIGRLRLPVCRVQTGISRRGERRDKKGGRALTVLSE